MQMKLLILVFIVLLGGAFAAFDMLQAPRGESADHVPSVKAIPDAAFVDYQGNAHSLYAFKGRPVLVNMWATWCGPCIAEFPDILHIAQSRDDMIVLAVSVDLDVADIDGFLRRLPSEAQTRLEADNFIIAHDPDQRIAGGIFETARYPESFILDEQMRIVRKISGPLTGDDIQSLLAGK